MDNVILPVRTAVLLFRAKMAQPPRKKLARRAYAYAKTLRLQPAGNAKENCFLKNCETTPPIHHSLTCITQNKVCFHSQSSVAAVECE